MAPLAATPDWFAERGHRLVPLSGPLSVGVPGALGVMEELATSYGRLGFSEHFAAALRHADRGFPISAPLAGLFGAHLGRLAGDPESSRIYGGVREGRVLVQQDLARSIEAIALEGSRVLYEGRLGEAIAASVAAGGGLLTTDDLAANRVDVYSAPSIDYRGTRIHETAPPSQGMILLEELKILETFDLAGLPADGAEAIHLLVEAKKLAVEDRLAVAGDPRFVDFDLQRILSADHAAGRARLIDPEHTRAALALPPPRATRPTSASSTATAWRSPSSTRCRPPSAPASRSPGPASCSTTGSAAASPSSRVIRTGWRRASGR